MKETFEPAWLALRESADHRARSDELVGLLAAWWAERGASAVLDLGCGTGSNLRYLAPRLPRPQRWTLLDHDPEVLARVVAPGADVTIRPVRGDLTVEGLAEVPRADVVTASALLDLVSERWLRELAGACAAAGAGVLFALSYDGRVQWSGPADAADALVLAAVNEHQRRDKGLGSALGPTAAAAAAAIFRAEGYRTRVAASPWVLGAADAELAGALVGGWAAAATEQRPDRADVLAEWAERRSAVVASGDFSLSVGHQDLLALPAAPGPERRPRATAR